MQNRIMLGVVALTLLIMAALATYIAVTPPLAPGTLQPGTLQAEKALSVSSAQAAADANIGIRASGEGKVRVKPNIAMANIGVEITAVTLAEATSQANSKMNAVIEKVKRLGVAEKDIQTISYDVDPITKPTPTREGAPPAITGYRVSNQLRVTVRKIDDVGKILDAAVAAGANTISGFSFSVDDPKPYQEQARAAAVKNAQEKAAQLAKAAGIQLGKVLLISEGMGPVRPFVRGAEFALAESAAAVPVEVGELEITVQVEVRFAIQ